MLEVSYSWSSVTSSEQAMGHCLWPMTLWPTKKLTHDPLYMTHWSKNHKINTCNQFSVTEIVDTVFNTSSDAKFKCGQFIKAYSLFLYHFNLFPLAKWPILNVLVVHSTHSLCSLTHGRHQSLERACQSSLFSSDKLFDWQAQCRNKYTGKTFCNVETFAYTKISNSSTVVENGTKCRNIYSSNKILRLSRF